MSTDPLEQPMRKLAASMRQATLNSLYMPVDLSAYLRLADTVPLVPVTSRKPVELAVIDSIASQQEPETFLWIVFYRPDGGANIRYAWTGNGAVLGDRIDQLALAMGLDCADWLHITDLHCRQSSRGRIAISAYALRPLLADVQRGTRSPETRRDGVRRIIACAAERSGQIPRPGIPGWTGVGPSLLNRRTP
ncbi:hypothetical protein ACIQI8_27175 [Streptomyces sp. NPDC092369]|uniref:hypothetical protein n=1 Tax=Streptomyces sp. NPDC092369 TaxID=3366015 RepID=UPI00382EBEFB